MTSSGANNFSRKRRLSKSGQFKLVFNDSIRLNSNTFVVLLRLTDDTDTPRLGLAIAKRYVPRAVDRNLIRRQIRECFRTRCSNIPAVDLVFLLRKKPDELSRQSLQSEIKALWERLEKRCAV